MSESPLSLADRSTIERRIVGALRSAIAAHGPITNETVSSAAKRVYAELKVIRREQVAAGASRRPPKAGAIGAPDQEHTDA